MTINTKEKDQAEQIELTSEETKLIQIQSREFLIYIVKDIKDDFDNT